MHTSIVQQKTQATQKPRRLVQNTLAQNTEGTMAVEFAILGIPFAALLFGIVEISILFFLTSTTHHAVAEVSRQVRTGEFQSSGGGSDEFKAAICTAMAGVGDCSNLRVDVVSSGTGQFADLNLPVSPPSCSGSPAQIAACQASEPEMPDDVYNDTNGGDVVIVRVQYVHKLSIPNEITRLSNAAGNTHVITATTAFKNEPF